MFLLNDPNLVFFDGKFENGDQVIGHELCRNTAADQPFELFAAAADVLLGLHDGKLVLAASVSACERFLAPLFRSRMPGGTGTLQ